MSILYDLLGDSDVLFIGESAAVKHDTGETVVNALLANLKAVTVVEVKGNLRIGTAELLGILHSTLSHVAEDGAVSVGTSTLADLHDDGRLGFHGSLHNSLHLLHGVEVEGGDGIATGNGLLEHFTGVYQPKFFVTGHNFNSLMFIIGVNWKLIAFSRNR